MSILKNKDVNAIKIYESIGGLKHVVMESIRLDECIAFATEHKDNICGAMISKHYGFNGENLDFLKGLPWLTRLMVCDEYQDISAVSSLKNLDYLQLTSIPSVDFSTLVNLRTCSGDWPQNNDSFYMLKNIHSLSLWKGSKKNSIGQLSAFTKLESLSLAELTLDTLQGIEKIPLLKSLGVHFCSKITSIESVGNLKNLTNVHFENCRKIISFSPLANNSNLETIDVEKCGEMDNIDFVPVLPALKRLFFFGTIVNSNDLSPILKCKSLEKLAFNDKKSYSHTCKEIRQALGISLNKVELPNAHQ